MTTRGIPTDYPPSVARRVSQVADSWKRGTCEMMTQAAVEFGRPMIVGVERQHYGPRRLRISIRRC